MHKIVTVYDSIWSHDKTKGVGSTWDKEETDFLKKKIFKATSIYQMLIGEN